MRGQGVRLADLVTAEQQAREDAAATEQEFLEFLEGFRHTAVLVPLGEHGGLWSAELGGIRWIFAFSDEESLARFALARRDMEISQPALHDVARQGEDQYGWEYQKLLGWRLLDSVVPAVGGPCGVALDAGSADGRVLPPVAGVVPDTATVDAYTAGGGAT